MSEQILAFPLQWPLGWKRSDLQIRSAFKNDKTVYSATKEMMQELKRMKASDIVLSTNIPVKLDGLPYSTYKTPADKGVAAYFKLKNIDHVLACDKWDKIEHNIYAIAKHVEALRGQERWGVGNLEQAFSGFKALPAASENTASNFWKVLGFADGSNFKSVTVDHINMMYRFMAKINHPDVPGGSEEKMQELNAAKEEALEYIQQFK